MFNIFKKKETEFHYDRWGTDIVLRIGQKVKCVYYHEQIQYPFHFINPFTPVKFGVIKGSAGIRPYYLAGGNGKEQYLYVKFDEYIRKKAIPISCIYDAIEAAKKDELFLNAHKHQIGEKGYSIDSYLSLTDILKKNKEFIK